MKKLVTTMFLICAAMLLFSPQLGFAWDNVNQGCTTCHPAPVGGGLHTPHASLTCSACHEGGAPGKNVAASACIVCHPRGDTGLCPLIDLPAHASQKTTCLGCHPGCAPATTTTTTPANTTTTTPSETTTTTTAPAGAIITIDPAEIEVDGTNDVTQDINVTIDASDLTEADLEGLEVSFSDACSDYIEVNTFNYAISGQKAEGTVNITVKGDAPTSECTLTAKNTSGTIDIDTKFTITSTAAPDCQIKSISPSTVRIGFGIFPRIRRFTITFNIDIEALGITGDDLLIDTPNARVLAAEVNGDTITALVLLFGLKPGTYNVNIGECGTIPIIVTRF